ncbi:DUF2325 domain-containing protein [Rhodocyclus tenuis]|nr:DUF2325 domain-containing protein [Rhodocyclus gracilis]
MPRTERNAAMHTPPFPLLAGREATLPSTFPVAEAFTHHRVPLAVTSAGSRRRKLWELDHRFHCPLVGVCFEVNALREVVARHFHCTADTSDFSIHTSAVSACQERSPLAEVLHKLLEKRFQLSIRRFAEAKTTEALRAHWREATHSGSDLPAALWSIWTHPACDKALTQEVYADIHMIQHQVGTGTRADLAQLKTLRHDNQKLREQLDATRRDADALRSEKAAETLALRQQLAELHAELAGKSAQEDALKRELQQLHQLRPALKELNALRERAQAAETKASELSRANILLRKELSAAQRQRPATCASAAAATNEPSPLTQGSDTAKLDGKCVLCVGGRTGAVDACRQVVETRGGRFLHHDGGVEENPHRIDAAVAAADLIICQAACISHSAYWRVKEQCKRTGKRCLFLKTTGISSLSRLLDTAGKTLEAPAGDEIAV